MKKNRLNSLNFGISLKTSLACSIILLLLLAGSSIISINLQSSLARGMIDRYGEMQKVALKEHTKTEKILLADIAKINAEICSGISESFLYNFDQIRLKTLLMTFLQIESIKAITVVDASNSPFAAAWKDPEITTGKSLPKNFTVDETLSFKSKAMHEKDDMGTIQVFYTDQFLVKELAKKQAQTESDSQNF